MRDRDWDEIRCCLWDDDKERFLYQSQHVLNSGSTAWIARWDGEPVAVVGCLPLWPGVWQAFMYSTNRFACVSKGLTRALAKSIIPTLAESGGFHRVQCHSIEGYEEAHRWLLSLGAKREAVIPGYGRGGENFVTFSWTSDHVQRRQ